VPVDIGARDENVRHGSEVFNFNKSIIIMIMIGLKLF
jgi:hypothetical protein